MLGCSIRNASAAGPDVKQEITADPVGGRLKPPSLWKFIWERGKDKTQRVDVDLSFAIDTDYIICLVIKMYFKCQKERFLAPLHRFCSCSFLM